jgi:hypothetical protein
MPGGHYEPFLSGHEQAAEAELSIRKFTQWASRWVSARSLCRLARGSRYASSRSRRCRRWQPAREKAAAVDAPDRHPQSIPRGTVVPAVRSAALSCREPGCGRFHQHGHLRVTPHGGTGSYRSSKNRPPKMPRRPNYGPGHGRGDNSEAHPYPEAERLARARLV